MNLKIRLYIYCAAVIVAIYPCSAHAAGWVFTSVKTFGAFGNGTTDDTLAINHAIAAGTAIYFPPGSYLYTGPMTLPSNKSYRLYGDGPGVSTILFTTNPLNLTAGINGPNIGPNTLNVEGLTLKANSYNCGTAISALFSESGANTKFRTATIHNVQIIGSTQTRCSDCAGATGTYWTNGIYLYKAQNAVIDKVEISGNNRDEDHNPPGPPSQTGIVWESSNDYATTGLQLSSLEIKFVNTALRTNGWVEGLYLFGFEFVLCGQHGMPAVDLNSFDPANLKPAFHLINGHVNSLQDGIRLTNLRGIKISKVLFIHDDSIYAASGNDLAFNNCTDAVISQSSFLGVGTNIADETGILLNNAHSVQITGNYFTHMLPANLSDSCIAVQSNSTVVRITNNLFESTGGFGGVRHCYDDAGPDTYYRGNNCPIGAIIALDTSYRGKN